MWCTSQVVLDETVKILVFSIEDVVVMTGVFLVTNDYTEGMLWSFLWSGSAGAALYYLQRGQPAGYLLHLAHRLFYPLIRLPGLMPPYRQRFDPW